MAFVEKEVRPLGEPTPSRESDVGLDEASKRLLALAALIEDRGLERKHFTNSGGGLCIQGGLFVLEGRDPAKDHCGLREQASNQALGRIGRSVGMMAHAWIMDANVTPQMVVAKLRAVALGG